MNIRWMHVFLLSSLLITACSKHKEPANVVTVGTIAGPETKLMEVAKQVASKRYGLHIKIIRFSDYNTPNAALADGSIDANAFQHKAYLNAQIAQRGYSLVAVGKTFVFPMGIYSKTIHSIAQLKPKSLVAIPNDPTNEGRALKLLEQAKLITLNPKSGLNATPMDITKNPLQLKFIPLGAPELPRALSEVSIALINTNYAIPAGLSPVKDAIFAERKDSDYVNLIVARKDNANTKKIKELVKSYQSLPVLEAAKATFGQDAIPAFTVKQKPKSRS